MSKGLLGFSDDIQIDAISPINWLVPLNKNLRINFVAIPGWTGGGTFQDLTEHPPGVLVGDAKWNLINTRPGGWGSLESDSTGYVSLGSNSLILSTTPFTLAWWECVGTSPTTFPAIFRANADTIQFIVLHSSHVDYQSMVCGKADGSTAVRFTTAPSLASSVGIWRHWCILGRGGMASNTPGDYSLYVDGVSHAASAATTLAVTGTASYFGWDGADDKWKGLLDDFRLYSRVLTETEVLRLRESSMTGYLDQLNRLPRRAWLGFSEAGTVFTATIAVTTAAVTGSLAATTTEPVYTSTIAVTTDETTGSLVATFTPVAITSTLALTTAAATTAIDATFTGPLDATIDVTTAATTGTLAATFTQPIFTSTVGLTTAATTTAIATTFTPVAVTSTLGLTTAPVSGVISATFTEQGVFGSSITVTTAAITGSLAASSTLVSITSTLALTAKPVTGSLVGTVSVPTFSATIGVTTAAATSVSSASFVAAGTVDATIAVTTGFVTGQLDATFTSPSTTCVVNVEVGAATCTILMGGSVSPPTIAERFCVPAIQRRFTVPARKKCR